MRVRIHRRLWLGFDRRLRVRVNRRLRIGIGFGIGRWLGVHWRFRLGFLPHLLKERQLVQNKEVSISINTLYANVTSAHRLIKRKMAHLVGHAVGMRPVKICIDTLGSKRGVRHAAIRISRAIRGGKDLYLIGHAICRAVLADPHVNMV